MMRGRNVALVCAGIVLVAFGSILVPTLLARRDPPPPLPHEGALPAEALPPGVFVDHTGAPITADSLRGHVVIVDFVFTRCDSICPLLSGKMRRVQDQTADVGADVKLVSFSVDPAYDTPSQLAAYAQSFHADDRRWRFVTSARGERADMAPIAAALMSPLQDAGTTPSGAPDIVHSPYFFLLDRNLELRGHYDSDDAPRVEKMLIHARRLLREQ